MNTFFAEPTVDRGTDSLKWWRENSKRLPLLAKIARLYLAPPPTSVDSERLFSSAGDICTSSRSNLLPENAEQLIFLKMNLPAVKYMRHGQDQEENIGDSSDGSGTGDSHTDTD